MAGTVLEKNRKVCKKTNYFHHTYYGLDSLATSRKSIGEFSSLGPRSFSIVTRALGWAEGAWPAHHRLLHYGDEARRALAKVSVGVMCLYMYGMIMTCNRVQHRSTG